jgi:hypothetical protein
MGPGLRGHCTPKPSDQRAAFGETNSGVRAAAPGRNEPIRSRFSWIGKMRRFAAGDETRACVSSVPKLSARALQVLASPEQTGLDLGSEATTKQTKKPARKGGLFCLPGEMGAGIEAAGRGATARIRRACLAAAGARRAARHDAGRFPLSEKRSKTGKARTR